MTTEHAPRPGTIQVRNWLPDRAIPSVDHNEFKPAELARIVAAGDVARLTVDGSDDLEWFEVLIDAAGVGYEKRATTLVYEFKR